MKYETDPTIGFRAGSAKRRLDNSFTNPLGGFSTPQRDEAIRRAGHRSIDEQAGMESRAGAFDANRMNIGKQQFLAGLTAPPLVQSGSSHQQTDQFRSPFSSKILPAMQSAAQGAALFASDAKLKDVRGKFSRGLSAITKIEPARYNWKGESKIEGGLIAQNVREAIPEAVVETSRGLAVSTPAILATLINAVKELNTKIDKLSA